MWPSVVFNLCVALLLAAWLLRAVRRYERTVDRIIAKMDAADDASQRAFAAARDEIRASMRVQVNDAIAEMKAKLGGDAAGTVIEGHNANTLEFKESSEAHPDSLPTEDEIRELPRWARVAFAARCARRMLPLVKQGWKDAPEHHLETLKRAVSYAERDATYASTITFFLYYSPYTSLLDAFYKFDNARAARASVAHAAHAANVPDITYRAAAAAVAADATAVAATRASHNIALHNSHDDAYHAADAARATAASAIVRGDFEIVFTNARANNWTDSTPVPPSVFGPLWPEGPPEDWPKPAEQSATELVFMFDVPDDMAADDAIELAKELSAALCELDLAGGGHGLVVPDPEQNPVKFTGPVRGNPTRPSSTNSKNTTNPVQVPVP